MPSLMHLALGDFVDEMVLWVLVFFFIMGCSAFPLTRQYPCHLPSCCPAGALLVEETVNRKSHVQVSELPLVRFCGVGRRRRSQAIAKPVSIAERRMMLRTLVENS